MDGLDFCKKAYALFEGIRRSPDGSIRLRLRKGRLEKKLIEELMPIARYIQARYSYGRQIDVRWIDGTQNFVAELLSRGALVDKSLVPESQYIEVTTAVHENDYILRRLIDELGHSFDAKGFRKDPKTKNYKSDPYVYQNLEAQDDLYIRILERIKEKNEVDYPKRTTLIIQCFLDTLFFEDEWEYAIQKVRNSGVVHKFYEIFVFDSNHHYSATLYSNAE
jgi:hypothetical protein